jgi:hypothetical protein
VRIQPAKLVVQAVVKETVSTVMLPQKLSRTSE